MPVTHLGGLAGGITGKASPVAYGQAKSMTQLIGYVSHWCLLSPGCCSFRTFYPPIISTPQYSEWARNKWVSLIASHTAGDASSIHSHTVSFSPWEKSQAEKILLALLCAALGEG